MSTGLYSHTTRATGTVLTASIYNSDHQNHITNQNPSATGGYSDSVGQMQALADPGGVGSESLAPHLAGELERLRFCVKRITGQAHWYVAPANNLSAISSPVDLTVSETLRLTGDLTPAQINANQNDYAPAGHADAFTIRLSSDAIRTITGLAGGIAGRIVELANVGANAIQLTHEDAGSAAGNRFTLNSGQAPIILSAGEAMMFKYDGTLSRWRPMNSADMANPSFANGTFSGFLDQAETTPPANPAADTLRQFAKDNGGKTVPAWLDSAGADPTIPAMAYGEYLANADITTSIPRDDTIPQDTEGTQILSAAITLKRPNSKLRIRFQGWGTCLSAQNDDTTHWIAALFLSGTASAIDAAMSGPGSSNTAGTNYLATSFLAMEIEVTPGGVGPFTYNLRVGVDPTVAGATLRMNGTSLARLFGGVSRATLILEELFV